MATNDAANGVTHKFNHHFTENVINATGPKASPRMRKVISGLIRHLHDFCREEEITVDEWMAAVEFVSKDYSDTRNCD
jgi:catechol 1,2-dioxygenase